MVVLDTFLTQEECDRLIYLGGEEGYNRSADVGQEKEDGTFDLDYNKYVHDCWMMPENCQ